MVEIRITACGLRQHGEVGGLAGDEELEEVGGFVGDIGQFGHETALVERECMTLAGRQGREVVFKYWIEFVNPPIGAQGQHGDINRRRATVGEAHQVRLALLDHQLSALLRRQRLTAVGAGRRLAFEADLQGIDQAGVGVFDVQDVLETGDRLQTRLDVAFKVGRLRRDRLHHQAAVREDQADGLCLHQDLRIGPFTFIGDAQTTGSGQRVLQPGALRRIASGCSWYAAATLGKSSSRPGRPCRPCLGK